MKMASALFSKAGRCLAVLVLVLCSPIAVAQSTCSENTCRLTRDVSDLIQWRSPILISANSIGLTKIFTWWKQSSWCKQMDFWISRWRLLWITSFRGIYFNHLTCKFFCDLAQNTSSDPKQFIFVHGMGGGAWFWYEMITLLEHYGHKAIAVDLTSHGINKAVAENVITVAQYTKPLIDALTDVSGEVSIASKSDVLSWGVGWSLIACRDGFRCTYLLPVRYIACRSSWWATVWEGARSHTHQSCSLTKSSKLSTCLRSRRLTIKACSVLFRPMWADFLRFNIVLSLAGHHFL